MRPGGQAGPCLPALIDNIRRCDAAVVKHGALISCLCKQGNDRACQANKTDPGQAYLDDMEQLEQEHKKRKDLKKVKGNVKARQ